jgi:indole-3-glycerol phosphate synthase
MSRAGILGRIVERTLEDVRDRRPRVSVSELERRARDRSGTRLDFLRALERKSPEDPVRFICEIKKASPSRGVLRGDLDPAEQAGIYRDNGASAISVVTEPHFFQGSGTFIEMARAEARDLPILRKDFHVDELQILEAAAGEADALLLLASVLSPTQLKDYLDIADAFRLGHLVEVTDHREAEIALKAGARVVGVNNRDLVTFEVDPARTESVLPLLDEAAVVTVSESGIHDRETVLHLQRRGVHALLVGEALVTAEDPATALRELRGVTAG